MAAGCDPGGNSGTKNNGTGAAAGAQNPMPATVPVVVLANPLAGCQQCHVDVETKYVKSRHSAAKVACTNCHGPSKGHLADENNEVKPDVRFVRAEVDRLCGKCHACSRPAEMRAGEKVCTDCHGSHVLVRK